MDAPQSTDLGSALTTLGDPRHARGRRYAWPTLLTLIAAAVASGQQGVRAIAQWVREHATEVGPAVGLMGGRVPSEATVRRTVHALDAATLEAALAGFIQTLPAPPPTGTEDEPASPWVGLALDGKAVCGANRHGAQVHLLSLVRHDDGRVVDEVLVPDKTNEITAAPALLARHDLTGAVVTLDALLTQRAIAQTIRAQGGHYLMVVKQNQPELWDALTLWFTDPPPDAPAPVAGDGVTTYAKGHGRLEIRHLDRSAALNGYLGWPAVGQVLRRTCQRVGLGTGELGEETSYAVTSLDATATAAQLEALWRGHWTIENRVHHVRDRTFGEDGCQVWHGSGPQVLAALRNVVLSLRRSQGWTNVADALRHYGASASRALHLITDPPTPRL
jgi:predicted transposase YbfD/YdcC